MAAGFGTIPTTERVHALSLSFHTALQTMTVGSRETTQILQRVCENNKALFNVRVVRVRISVNYQALKGMASPSTVTWFRRTFPGSTTELLISPKRAFPWFPRVVCLDANPIHFRLYVTNGTGPCLCYDHIRLALTRDCCVGGI